MKKFSQNLMKSTLIVMVLLFAGVSVIAGTPDFSGKWKLNSSKSKLSAQYSFAPQTLTITQEANSITVERTINMQGSNMDIVEKVTLDGAECINDGYQGSKKYSTATWNDDQTSLTIKNKIGGADMTSIQIYSLEGGALKVESSYTSGYGDMKETWVLDKE